MTWHDMRCSMRCLKNHVPMKRPVVIGEWNWYRCLRQSRTTIPTPLEALLSSETQHQTPCCFNQPTNQVSNLYVVGGDSGDDDCCWWMTKQMTIRCTRCCCCLLIMRLDRIGHQYLSRTCFCSIACTMRLVASTQ
jgi:hypothetical protein